jgi:hypothetical protein
LWKLETVSPAIVDGCRPSPVRKEQGVVAFRSMVVVKTRCYRNVAARHNHRSRREDFDRVWQRELHRHTAAFRREVLSKGDTTLPPIAQWRAELEAESRRRINAFAVYLALKGVSPDERLSIAAGKGRPPADLRAAQRLAWRRLVALSDAIGPTAVAAQLPVTAKTVARRRAEIGSDGLVSPETQNALDFAKDPPMWTLDFSGWYRMPPPRNRPDDVMTVSLGGDLKLWRWLELPDERVKLDGILFSVRSLTAPSHDDPPPSGWLPRRPRRTAAWRFVPPNADQIQPILKAEHRRRSLARQ